MRRIAIAVLATLCAGATFVADPDQRCDSCEGWNRPQRPFQIYGNTYYVGVGGLSSVLVTSAQGHILLDGGLTQSAALIAQNIRTLGFRVEDVRLIVNSHAHFDHAGGIAALQRASGAIVGSSAAGARALSQGLPTDDDPQSAFGAESNAFPRIKQPRVVEDGATLLLTGTAITAHYTPGHTPGSTTWTWRSCENARCLDIVYADSLNAVAAPGYRFSERPSVVESFRRSIAAVAAIPCDVLISVHPEFTKLDAKLAQRATGAKDNPFIDAQACRAYAAAASQALERKLASEQKS